MDRRRFVTGLGNLVAAPAIVRASPPGLTRGGAISLESGFDGFGNAPTGTPQYTTYFTSLNGISPYLVRPPWHVAGVDYRVGISTGVSLKDPATINPKIATMSGTNPIVLTVQADNVTFDGYDFTRGGWWQIRSSGHSHVTVSNCRLQNFCLFIDTGPLTVQYCEIDGLGATGETVFGCLAFLGAGVTSTWKYNWIHDSQNDFIDLHTSDITAWFNLFDTMGYAIGAHADSIQFAGAGTANNISIKFNTYVHRIATKSSLSSFIDLETQIDARATMNNPEVAYNTASNTAVGGARGSTFYRVGTASGTVNNPHIHDNYADATNMITVFSARGAGLSGLVKSRNILLKTGGSF